MAHESSLPENLRTTLVLLATVCASALTTLVVVSDRVGIRIAALTALGTALIAIVRPRSVRLGD